MAASSGDPTGGGGRRHQSSLYLCASPLRPPPYSCSVSASSKGYQNSHVVEPAAIESQGHRSSLEEDRRLLWARSCPPV